MSGEKSSPRESSDVVTITCASFFTSLEDVGADGRADWVSVSSLATRFRRNPSRCLFEPRPRCSLWLVIATLLIPCSARYALSSTTLALLLQNIRTLERLPVAVVAASSAQMRRMRRRISANLLPPVQSTYSVCNVLGKWCRWGEARRTSDG